MDLVGERLHVFDQAGFEEGGFIPSSVGQTFLEEAGEDLEVGDEGGNGDIVEGGHCEFRKVVQVWSPKK